MIDDEVEHGPNFVSLLPGLLPSFSSLVFTSERAQRAERVLSNSREKSE